MMRKLFVLAGVLASLAWHAPAVQAQNPYPGYPNQGNRQYVDIYGSIQNLNGQTVTVATQQGTFIYILSRHVDYPDLRYIRIGSYVRIHGHLSHSTNQLVVDSIERFDRHHHHD